MWDLHTGDTTPLAEVPHGIGGVALVDEGRLVLVAGADGLRVYSLRDGSLAGHVRTEPLRAIAASGDGVIATLSATLGMTTWKHA